VVLEHGLAKWESNYSIFFLAILCHTFKFYLLTSIKRDNDEKTDNGETEHRKLEEK